MQGILTLVSTTLIVGFINTFLSVLGQLIIRKDNKPSKLKRFNKRKKNSFVNEALPLAKKK